MPWKVCPDSKPISWARGCLCAAVGFWGELIRHRGNQTLYPVLLWFCEHVFLCMSCRKLPLNTKGPTKIMESNSSVNGLCGDWTHNLSVMCWICHQRERLKSVTYWSSDWQHLCLFVVCLSLQAKASALVFAAEALSSMESCELLDCAEQVCDSRGGTGVPRGEEGIAVFLCSLLAVESHWKVLSLLQLVMLEFEPAESLGPVLCEWEKAALPRELGWINSQNSACTWQQCLAPTCSSYQYFWKRFTNHTNTVIITCALRTWAKQKTRLISHQLIEISWAVAADYPIASCQFSSSFVLRLVCFQHGVRTGAEVTHMPRKHLYEQSTQDKHFQCVSFQNQLLGQCFLPSWISWIGLVGKKLFLILFCVCSIPVRRHYCTFCI